MRQATSYDAFIWLAFTVLGFVAPVLIGIVIRGAVGSPISLGWIAGGGQFAISGAALLMTTSYFVARPGSISRLPLTEWFMLLSIVGLVIGVVLYALATLTASQIDIDTDYYEWPSIALFICALIVAFIAVALDKTRDINEPGFLDRGMKEGRTSLEEGFNSTFESQESLYG